MPRQSDRATVNATVPPDVKEALVGRAVAEDRLESAVVRRALDCYLVLSLEDAERAVAEARKGTPMRFSAEVPTE